MLGTDKPVCLHLESHQDKLGASLFMIKPVSQGLNNIPPVTLTTNNSVLPIPGIAIMSLFQKVVMAIL